MGIVVHVMVMIVEENTKIIEISKLQKFPKKYKKVIIYNPYQARLIGIIPEWFFSLFFTFSTFSGFCRKVGIYNFLMSDTLQ